MFEAILVDGFLAGGMYAILALGFSLVFGVANILNMAHTAFYMITAYVLFVTNVLLGLPLVVSFVMSVAATGIIGILCYQLFFDRIKEHETAVMIVSIALAMLFQEILLLVFGGEFRGLPHFVPGFFMIAGVRVLYQHVFAIGAWLAVIGLIWFLLFKTKLGNAIRTVSQDREVALLLGINVGRICLITVGFSAVLAGIAGGVIAPIFMAEPFMWIHPLVIVLAAVVLGGLGSIKGSVIAAFILGLTETMAVTLFPGVAFLKGAVSLTIMILVLLLKPEGLFGVVFEEERL